MSRATSYMRAGCLTLRPGGTPLAPDDDVAAAYASAKASRHPLSGLSVVRYHLDRDGAKTGQPNGSGS